MVVTVNSLFLDLMTDTYFSGREKEKILCTLLKETKMELSIVSSHIQICHGWQRLALMTRLRCGHLQVRIEWNEVM